MVINKYNTSSLNSPVLNPNNTRTRMMNPQRRRLSENTTEQQNDVNRMAQHNATADIASVMENFKNKNSLVAARQNKLNALNSLNQRSPQLSSTSSQVGKIIRNLSFLLQTWIG
ncbi:uncharacterized protein LOC113379813 [Ctenocephalides felis]|uniref:uncharacterized protein LOC113379813 n=1 Tax=Ctenocephalides felis TaxID=7515 RepID=UPI000E6E1B44|nr:uncharacterized protein LOC113379813 [Ctenocephalides felis]